VVVAVSCKLQNYEVVLTEGAHFSGLAIFFVCVCFIASAVPTAAQSPTDSGTQVRAFSGTIVPARAVEISPRYNGLLSKINFVPGQFVEQGDLLFEFRTAEQELLLDIDRSKLQRSEADLRCSCQNRL